jgi:hypothetical protein
MSEIALKNESVIEIGKAVGTQLAVSGGGGKSLSGGNVSVAQPMNPFESMMVVLEDIRDGIHQVVDRLSDSVSIQQDQIADQNAAADLAQAGGGEDIGGFDDGGGDTKMGFLEKGKEKAKAAFGGFKDLLIKGGLIAGLLGLATVLKKYGRTIAEFITGGWEKLKAGVQSIIDFFSVTIPEKAKELKDSVVNFFTVTLPTKIEEIKTTLGEWFTSIKEGIADLFDKVKKFFTETIPTKYEEIKTTVTTWFTNIKEGIADLFKKIKDFFVVTIPTKYEEVKTIVTDWFTGIKDNVSDLFTKIKDFFVVTIPEKVQLIKDSITTWFTNIVDEVKGIFTKVKDFFIVTIPTKVQEIKDSITTWFTNIKDDVVGIFTKVKDFIFVTIPTKMKEIEKSIETKVGEIKDKIIDFAMAPFRKIRDLMKSLLIGVLESVENLPFIGAKATAMKNKILGIDENETGTTTTEALDNAGTAEGGGAGADKTGQFKISTNEEAKVTDPASGKVVKFGRYDIEGATEYANEISKMGQGKFEPFFETDGLNHYAIKKVGESVTGQSTTTGGATGGEVNSASAEAAAAANGGSGGVVVGGSNTQNVTNSNVQHTTIDEKVGVSDTQLGDALTSD